MANNKHPDNAAYVSADGLVSFDRYGRKLDSGGNVAWGDYQSAGDAGASPIERKQPQQQQQMSTADQWKIVSARLQQEQAARRSTWDNSVLPDNPTVAAPPIARGNNPNVLAPGGIDPSTGQPYPTARNGGVQARTSAWRQPWMNAPRPTSAYSPPAPMPQQAQSYVPPAVDMPQPNAFQQAAAFWPGGGLPFANGNAQQYDPMQQDYSIYPMQGPTSVQRGVPSGLPMPNNRVFDPYRP
jgi:hypothetical protein